MDWVKGGGMDWVKGGGMDWVKGGAMGCKIHGMGRGGMRGGVGKL